VATITITGWTSNVLGFGGGTKGSDGPGPTLFLWGPRHKWPPHCFTAFLLFSYKVHHLRNFTVASPCWQGKLILTSEENASVTYEWIAYVQ